MRPVGSETGATVRAAKSRRNHTCNPPLASRSRTSVPAADSKCGQLDVNRRVGAGGQNRRRFVV